MCVCVCLCVPDCDLVCLYAQVLSQLGRFAFTMLVYNRPIFTQEMIDDSKLSDEAIHLGLLISSDTLLGSRQYRFNHLSMQEFLAAFFIVQCLLKDVCHAQRFVMRFAEPSGHLSMFYRFLVAMATPEIAATLVQTLWFVMVNKIKPASDAAESVSSVVGDGTRISGILCTETDFADLRDLLAREINISQMQDLADILLMKAYGKNNGRRIVYNQVPGGREMTAELYLETLLLLWQEVEASPSGVEMYKALEKCNPEVAERCRSSLVPGEGSVSSGAETPMSYPKLDRPDGPDRFALFCAISEHMRQCHPGSVEVLLPVVSALLRIRDLAGRDLYLYSPSTIQIHALSFIFVSFGHVLCQICLHGYVLPRSCRMDVLLEGMQHCSAVTTLAWPYTVSLLGGGDKLASVIKHMPLLEDLDLRGWEFDDIGMQVLLQSLCQCAVLKKLNLQSYMSLTMLPLPAITTILEKCPQLTSLNLAKNNIVYVPRKEEEQFIDAVKQSRCLVELWMPPRSSARMVRELSCVQIDPSHPLTHLTFEGIVI